MSDSKYVPVGTLRANLPHGKGNLLRIWGEIPDSFKDLHRSWFTLAHREACRIGKAYDLSVDDVVTIAAILSPKLRWEVNMQAAEDCIRYWLSGDYVPPIADWIEVGGHMRLMRHRLYPDEPGISDTWIAQGHSATGVGALGANQIKSLWYLQGYKWVARGPKIERFRENILGHAKDDDVITCDSHWVWTWLGLYTQTGSARLPNGNWHDIIATDTVSAARSVGESPKQFMAIIWEWVRTLK